MSQIKPGDLVMIVRGTPCCGATRGNLGIPFIVGSVEDCRVWCNDCGSERMVRLVEAESGDPNAEAGMLIKIDPPAQDVETREEMVA